MSDLEITGSAELFEKLANDRGLDVYMCLLESPSSASDLSTRLHMSRAKINYLLDCLEGEALIQIHSEKRTGTTIEPLYAAKVDTFHLLAGTESPESKQIQAAMYILDIMKENIVGSIRSRSNSTHLGMVHVRIRRDQLLEYVERVKQLQAGFDQEMAEPEDESADWYTMVLSVFPGPTL